MNRCTGSHRYAFRLHRRMIDSLVLVSSLHCPKNTPVSQSYQAVRFSIIRSQYNFASEELFIQKVPPDPLNKIKEKVILFMIKS